MKTAYKRYIIIKESLLTSSSKSRWSTCTFSEIGGEISCYVKIKTLNLINKIIIKASEWWKKSKIGWEDPRTQRMTKQYILFIVFLPYPRSDAEEDGNLEKPMGPEKKISKKNSLQNPKRKEGHSLTREKISRQWPSYPAEHLWKKCKLTRILTDRSQLGCPDGHSCPVSRYHSSHSSGMVLF